MIWCPRQMPNTGTLPSSARDVVVRRTSTAAGSPGPFDRNTPSGSRASTSAAAVVRRARPRPGSPRATSWSRIERLMPKSYATTKRLASSGPTVYGSVVVTSATRSRPSVPPSACAAASSVSRSATPNAPGHRAGVADVTGQAAGVDAGDPGDARGGARKPVEVFGRAPVRRAGARGRGRSRRGSAARAPRRRRR